MTELIGETLAAILTPAAVVVVQRTELLFAPVVVVRLEVVRSAVSATVAALAAVVALAAA